jgi:hypothetical protein
MRDRLAGALLLLVASAVTAGAQVPAGSQFVVSDVGPIADSPRVAAAPDGNFIVVCSLAGSTRPASPGARRPA